MAEDLLKAGSDGKFPSKEELIDAIKKMTNLDEETKKKLLKDVLSSAPESGEGLPPPSADTIAAATSSLPLQMLMLLFLVSLVLMVLGEIFYFQINSSIRPCIKVF